jgi:hypothetical protein
MKNEIDKDYYCPILTLGQDCMEDHGCKNCKCKLHKHPTPEQYKEEYGEEVPEDMPVWILTGFAYMNDDCREWVLTTYSFSNFEDSARTTFYARDRIYKVYAIVIACTPFGKPDDKWRPE